MDFLKKHYTPAELDAEIRAARQTWNECDPELTHLLGKTEQDYLDSVAANCPLAAPEIVAAPELTKAERDEMDSQLLFEQMYSDRISESTGVAALAELVAANERADLEKLLAPARRAQSALDGMIDRAVGEALEKLTKRTGSQSQVVPGHSIPVRRAPERETIVTRLAVRAEEENADSFLTKWLQGYVGGDEQAMRRVARELAAG